MKATLEFIIPEESEEFDLAVNGHKTYSALHDMNQWLRAKIKYSDEGVLLERIEVYEECREKLLEIIQSYNIQL